MAKAQVKYRIRITYETDVVRQVEADGESLKAMQDECWREAGRVEADVMADLGEYLDGAGQSIEVSMPDQIQVFWQAEPFS